MMLKYIFSFPLNLLNLLCQLLIPSHRDVFSWIESDKLFLDLNETEYLFLFHLHYSSYY